MARKTYVKSGIKRHRRGTTEDYALLRIPENPWLFGVERNCVGAERFLTGDPEGKQGNHYKGTCQLVSPFWDFEENTPGESCTCVYWRTKRRRCIHLEKFFELNPDFEAPNLDENSPWNIKDWCKAWVTKQDWIERNKQDDAANWLHKKLRELHRRDDQKIARDEAWVAQKSIELTEELKTIQKWRKTTGS